MVRYSLIGILLLSCMAIASPGNSPPASSDSLKTDTSSRTDSLKADAGSRIRRPPEIAMFPMEAGSSRVPLTPAQSSRAGKEVIQDPLVDLSLFGYNKRHYFPYTSGKAGLETDPGNNPAKRPKYYDQHPDRPSRFSGQGITQGINKMDRHEMLINDLDQFHDVLFSPRANLQKAPQRLLRLLENRLATHHQRTGEFLNALRGPQFLNSNPESTRQSPQNPPTLASSRRSPPNAPISANGRQPLPNLPANRGQPLPDPPIEIVQLRSDLDKMLLRRKKMVDRLSYSKFRDEYAAAEGYGKEIFAM
ncbi:uncharacterized protein UTRI_04868 [Ustilago trichophora]|uniref:Uncharacterized protein n=1 Tax=Ustilago trichophora TaxID=86804 RepID=A0A5C3EG56_9BASI|nr:uncharacterized protein UTRI_04868 [Ustilago trichophora]